MIGYLKKGLKNRELEKLSFEELGRRRKIAVLTMIVCIALFSICTYLGITISGEARGVKLLGKLFIAGLIGVFVGPAMNLIGIGIGMEMKRRKGIKKTRSNLDFLSYIMLPYPDENAGQAFSTQKWFLFFGWFPSFYPS